MCSLATECELTFLLLIIYFVYPIDNLLFNGKVLFEVELVVGWERVEYRK